MKAKLVLQFFSKLAHCTQNCHTVHIVYFIRMYKLCMKQKCSKYLTKYKDKFILLLLRYGYVSNFAMAELCLKEINMTFV